MTYDKAYRMAGKAKAFEWYCNAAKVPPIDFSIEEIDQELIDMHGRAWAWATKHWLLFLAEVDDQEGRFFNDLFTRMEGDSCHF